MEDQAHLNRRRSRTAGAPDAASGVDACGPDAPASGGLLEQARGWGDVARAAYDDCEKGSDAEAELHRRRNQSGE